MLARLELKFFFSVQAQLLFSISWLKRSFIKDCGLSAALCRTIWSVVLQARRLYQHLTFRPTVDGFSLSRKLYCDFLVLIVSEVQYSCSTIESFDYRKVSMRKKRKDARHSLYLIILWVEKTAVLTTWTKFVVPAGLQFSHADNKRIVFCRVLAFFCNLHTPSNLAAKCLPSRFPFSSGT